MIYLTENADITTLDVKNLETKHLYQDLELALVNLKEHLEEADAKSGKRFAANWVIFACADACEGIE
jgi:hypothetical protein